jgi:transcription elongation factor SPT4
MVCSIVLAGSRFRREGCPNCEEFLELLGHDDAIQECTSQVFEGLITLTDPTSSWVARWQRLDSYVPGIYAVKVTGIVSINYIYTSLPILTLSCSCPKRSSLPSKPLVSSTSRESNHALINNSSN